MPSKQLREFAEPGTLRSIHPERLRQFLDPYSEYLRGRGVDLTERPEPDYDALTCLLLQPTADVPVDLIDALHLVHECASEADADELLKLASDRGLELHDDPQRTAVDIAIEIWLRNPELVREQHALAVAFRQESFFYFTGSGEPAPKTLPEPTHEVISGLQSELDRWFERHRGCGGTRVFLFPREAKLMIVIRHGKRVVREVKHGEGGDSVTLVYRPQIHDVLSYDATEDQIAVHAGGRTEIDLYLKLVGRHLFGRYDYFPASLQFTLGPLLKGGRAALNCEDVDGLEAVRLVELHRHWGGSQRETEIRKATDLFAAYAERDRPFPKKGRLDAAVFKVRFKDSVKERRVTIRTGGNARYERKGDRGTVELWLYRRGFVVPKHRRNDGSGGPILADGR